MKKNALALMSAIVLAYIAGQSCNTGSEKSGSAETVSAFTAEDTALWKIATNIFKPLPPLEMDLESPLFKLGEKLYHETALSANNQMSCNTCHQVKNFGVDNEPTSPSFDGSARGERNSPSSYHASLHIAQFWDGRAADLIEQAKGPILNPIEMGLKNEKEAVNRIKAIPDYKALFAEAFPGVKDPITYHNIALAIAEYEKALMSPAPFDAYLQGDLSSLDEQQRKGLKIFIETGCITCHTGVNLGGHMFQKFGLVKGPYWEFTGSEREDVGRYAVTNNEADMYVFKVPSLRNVEKTWPYFHDGSVADLGKAVKIMATTQLGRDLSNEQVNDIVAFLRSLTGEIPKHIASN
ncbi:cytochrome-c peroxidase [Schleiferia thermophila]|uniref:Cytochrome c peroxidase n=1 Tax=Schleiferia thermophila TaxID=884107 RepID=A0A369A6X3_9FLAO|nr:cytochrome c peroxidase [Schleiferia thermophila]RCX03827.1 cytochrome c peroxidase [Schleiferia thermophila]GCD80059.1 cytochrome-c peroxidase [Schleiferia thermophila]